MKIYLKPLIIISVIIFILIVIFILSSSSPQDTLIDEPIANTNNCPVGLSVENMYGNWKSFPGESTYGIKLELSENSGFKFSKVNHSTKQEEYKLFGTWYINSIKQTISLKFDDLNSEMLDILNADHSWPGLVSYNIENKEIELSIGRSGNCKFYINAFNIYLYIENE